MYMQMLQEKKRLENMEQSIKKQLTNLPEGRLIYSHDGNRCKFYQQTNQKRIYLSKEQYYDTILRDL